MRIWNNINETGYNVLRNNNGSMYKILGQLNNRFLLVTLDKDGNPTDSYVIVHSISINRLTNHISWGSGEYFNNYKDAVLHFLNDSIQETFYLTNLKDGIPEYYKYIIHSIKEEYNINDLNKFIEEPEEE